MPGRVLTVRFGELGHHDRASLYTLPIRFSDGSALSLRMTCAVMDGLFGPSLTGTPEYEAWEAERNRRRRDLGEEEHPSTP